MASTTSKNHLLKTLLLLTFAFAWSALHIMQYNMLMLELIFIHAPLIILEIVQV